MVARVVRCVGSLRSKVVWCQFRLFPARLGGVLQKYFRVAYPVCKEWRGLGCSEGRTEWCRGVGVVHCHLIEDTFNLKIVLLSFAKTLTYLARKILETCCCTQAMTNLLLFGLT